MKSKVLFVTRGDTGNFKEGFPYAVELAKIGEGGLFILFQYDKEMVNTFVDEMAAAAFAEAGEFESARSILSERNTELEKEAEQKVRLLRVISQGIDLIVEHKVTTNDMISAIKTVLQDHPSIEMVILSPSLTEKEKSISFKTLRRQISRPVVTMTRPAKA